MRLQIDQLVSGCVFCTEADRRFLYPRAASQFLGAASILQHILFADDDPDTRDMVEVFLVKAGFRVSLASNAAEVLEGVSSSRFDALVLDNWMPDKTGVELCEQIRLDDKSTPIFFCSGAASPADIEAATLAGAQGYFTKPFDPDDLVKTLHGLTQRKAVEN